MRLGLVLGAGALLVTALVVAVAPRVWQMANAHEELPLELPPMEPLAQRTYVYDAGGQLIAQYSLENSQPMSLSDVPDHVRRAFLAVEDKEFYNHEGVNIRSLVRASLSNLASDAPRQGASTITMQVVKNEFLANFENDGRYKLMQIHYALMLEKEMTKNQILERYLNTVFFGNNAYGIKAAAETYFGKPVQKLTFIEAVFLAGLVRSPSGYDPIYEPEGSRARFAQVLDRLAKDDFITKKEAEFQKKNFVLPSRVLSLNEAQTTRTYFTEALRDYLLNRSQILGDTYDERYSALYRGGLRIHTTLDTNLQTLAEQAHDIVPENDEGIDSAMVSLDSRTGAIRAMVGGDGFEAGENEINMALETSPTGSSIKFFILAAALQAGAQPNDTLMGEETCNIYDPNDPEVPYPIGQSDGAVVGHGLATLDEHTYTSANCAYSRLGQIVGLNRVIDTVYRMAASPYLSRDLPANDDYREGKLEPFASFATGSNEMSPLDMASGAQTIANEGVHHEPYYVEYIDNAEGKRLYTHESEGTQVLDRGVALTEISMLKKVLQSGGTAYLNPLEGGRPAAGKTGTYHANRHATFVGFTPQLTTSVWMGNPNGDVDMENVEEFAQFGYDYAEAVQGGRMPSLVWKTFMDPAHANLEVEDWAAPPPPKRKAARLFLPVMECRYKVTGYDTIWVRDWAGGESIDPKVLEAVRDNGLAQGWGSPAAAPTVPSGPDPTRGTVPPATDPPDDPPGGGEDGPGGDGPRRTTTTEPSYHPEQVPITAAVADTTIPPDVVDPYAPLPSAPTNDYVSQCWP